MNAARVGAEFLPQTARPIIWRECEDAASIARRHAEFVARLAADRAVARANLDMLATVRANAAGVRAALATVADEFLRAELENYQTGAVAIIEALSDHFTELAGICAAAKQGEN